MLAILYAPFLVNNRPSDPQNDNNSPFPNRNAQRFWLILGAVILLLFLFAFATPGNLSSGNRISLDLFAQYVKRGDVDKVSVRGGQDVAIDLHNGTRVSYYKERETNLFDALKTFGVTNDQIAAFTYEELPGDNTSGILFQLLIAVVPTLLIIWLLWRMMRSVRTGQDQALSFGRS